MLETGFVEIVKKIAEERGKDIFLEPNKFKSLLLDYAKNEFKKENAFLLSVLETDSVEYINRADDLAECKKYLVKRLDDEYGLSPSKSAEMLDLLFFVLRGKAFQTQVNISNDIFLPKDDAVHYARYLDFLNSGAMHFNKGEFDQAIADFSQAIQLDPNAIGAYLWRANSNRAYIPAFIEIAVMCNNPHEKNRIYDRVADYSEQAISDCNKVIYLDPNSAFAYFVRGNTYYDIGDFNLAIADCTQSIRLAPDLVEAYIVRGKAYKKRGNHNLADRDFAKAKELGYKQ